MTKIATEDRQFRVLVLAVQGKILTRTGRQVFEETRGILDWAADEGIVEWMKRIRRQGGTVRVDLKWDPPGQDPRWIPIALEDFEKRVARMVRATQPA